jgi:TRAP-type C4-dicarboxylate transport system permease small subunit
MTKFISKIDKGILAVEKPLMFFFGILLFGIMCFVVLARFVLKISTPYQTELTKFFHIWLCFTGGSYLIGTNGHPAVEFITSKVKTARPMIQSLYFTVLYCLILFFLGAALLSALRQAPLYIRQVTTYLEISYIWINGGVIVGLILMIFRCLIKIAYAWGGEKK